MRQLMINDIVYYGWLDSSGWENEINPNQSYVDYLHKLSDEDLFHKYNYMRECINSLD